MFQQKEKKSSDDAANEDSQYDFTPAISLPQDISIQKSEKDEIFHPKKSSCE